MSAGVLSEGRLDRAKSSYTVRHVPLQNTPLLLADDIKPAAGDLALARIDTIGQHRRIERSDGRKSTLFPGDEVIVAYGNRYAPDQFEANVPPDLGTCDLVAAGGLIARVLSKHATINSPTTVVPLGLIARSDGTPLNLREWGLPEPINPPGRPPTFAVLGSAMNAGKTTAAAGLIRGLTSAGLSVGAAKVTGTGAGGDLWLMKDAGAALVMDFTDAGYASTYRCSVSEVLGILRNLLGHLSLAGVDVIVIEVADGIFQDETSALVRTSKFANSVDGVLFAAPDALGAVAGVERLCSIGLAPMAITGALTASPLAAREARRELDGTLVVDAFELTDRSMAEGLFAMARHRTPAGRALVRSA